MTRTTPELAPPSPDFRTTRFPVHLTGLFWYPRLGWGTSLFPHVNNGKCDVSQPNWEYQNRPPNPMGGSVGMGYGHYTSGRTFGYCM
ncbi:hypothetical protein AVEN_99596-1 [Araneus ventricosus]|uniref:Uncharacterized protein n=1 Tax=Araneus ventricosus TaxID=182803 RepID=A0A4Y2ETZ9_ARAVE|nr:hypothetical protein AVEN_99596-1 [Araneus ventricosus]